MRGLRCLIALALLLLAAGCSSFDKKWRSAGQPGALQKAARYEGRWASDWHHTPGGDKMGGRLRCVFLPTEAGHSRAWFHANWLLFSGDYEVDFAGRRKLSGSHRLPAIFGGEYRYDALVTPDRFTAHYTSSYDIGTFVMTRQLTNPAPIH